MSQFAELSENQTIVSRFRNAGAAGFVFKHLAATDLVPAAEEALRGGPYVCPALQGLLPELADQSPTVAKGTLPVE
jgi:DNA-binding NarL/FixJ family response regulator